MSSSTSLPSPVSCAPLWTSKAPNTLRTITCCHCSHVHTFRYFTRTFSHGSLHPHTFLPGMTLKPLPFSITSVIPSSNQQRAGCPNPDYCPHAFCADCRVVVKKRAWECWACGKVAVGMEGCEMCGYAFGSEWTDREWIEVARSRKVEYKRWGGDGTVGGG